MTCWGASVAGHLIYQALGVADHHGVSQVGGHNHCQFLASQTPEVTSFVQKFLFGSSGSTTVLYTDQWYASFNLAAWAPWTVPALS